MEKLTILLDKLNTFYPAIKIIEEHSKYGISFLDTFTYIQKDQLCTRVYYKPTNDKQYLHYTSCHPLQQKNLISYGLLVRAMRLCTTEEQFITEARSIINKLRERKYPEVILKRTV